MQAGAGLAQFCPHTQVAELAVLYSESRGSNKLVATLFMKESRST